MGSGGSLRVEQPALGAYPPRASQRRGSGRSPPAGPAPPSLRCPAPRAVCWWAMTGFHVPTALVTILLIAVVWGAVRLASTVRGRSHGFLSDANRATYETLHTAALAARHLGSGLTAGGSAKAAAHQRMAHNSSRAGAAIQRASSSCLGATAHASQRHRPY